MKFKLNINFYFFVQPFSFSGATVDEHKCRKNIICYVDFATYSNNLWIGRAGVPKVLTLGSNGEPIYGLTAWRN